MLNHSAVPTGITCADCVTAYRRQRNLAYARSRLRLSAANATMNLKSKSSTKPRKRPVKPRDSRREALINQHALELVEELLNDIRFDQGQPWFGIVQRKMSHLVKAL